MVSLQGVLGGLRCRRARGEIFAANRNTSTVTVHARSANGNVSPCGRSPGRPPVWRGRSLAVDLLHELYVTNAKTTP
jgi:hypothetical protein